jgi:hypothetical protein
LVYSYISHWLDDSGIILNKKSLKIPKV